MRIRGRSFRQLWLLSLSLLVAAAPAAAQPVSGPEDYALCDPDPEATQELVPLANGQVLVRAVVPTLQDAYALAAAFEPVEADYDQRSLLLALDPDQCGELREGDIALEIDHAAMAAYRALEGTLQIGTAVGATIPGFPCYRTVEETYATAEALVAANPAIASLLDVGDSWEKVQGQGGYDLRVLRLSNDAVPGPKYSTTRFVPPFTVRISQTLRITSFGEDQPERLPVRWTPTLLG